MSYYGAIGYDLLNSFAQLVLTDSDSDDCPTPCQEKELLLLRETLPVIMSFAESHSDILALTSTCKSLHDKRWEYIAAHPRAMSSIFATALAGDCAVKNWYDFDLEATTENTGKILLLFENPRYTTRLSLARPIADSYDPQLFEALVEKIKSKFPETTTFEPQEEEGIIDELIGLFISTPIIPAGVMCT
ncbi:MAG: hypothetical protein JSR46_04970 [Verrucomicrobia bacterium]|nr:hypothetical protein [Verrucomicrobiota bacterium]